MAQRKREAATGHGNLVILTLIPAPTLFLIVTLCMILQALPNLEVLEEREPDSHALAKVP